MAIEVGQTLPDLPLAVMDAAGQHTLSLDATFRDKKVVIFAVPGAFTPTCSEQHLPGFIEHFQAIKDKGVDMVICLSVNDAFVMHAWGKSYGEHDIVMAADGDGAYAEALGLSMQTGPFGGLRAQRFALIVENGVVTQSLVEAPKSFEVSSAESVLKHL